MSDDSTPDTQPAGALDPPRRQPPTAVGAMTPEREPDPRRHHGHPERSASPLDALLRPLVAVVRRGIRTAERIVGRL
jgi:hypothetical protein